MWNRKKNNKKLNEHCKHIEKLVVDIYGVFTFNETELEKTETVDLHTGLVSTHQIIFLLFKMDGFNTKCNSWSAWSESNLTSTVFS